MSVKQTLKRIGKSDRILSNGINLLSFWVIATGVYLIADTNEDSYGWFIVVAGTLQNALILLQKDNQKKELDRLRKEEQQS